MAASFQLGSRTVGDAPLVVGVAGRLETLRAEPARQADACDVLEVRADLLGAETDLWLRAQTDPLRRRPPLLLTVRTSREGGRFEGSEAERTARYAELIPFVAAVDVELESSAFADVCAAARAERRCVIASFHDFVETPPAPRLRELIEQGRRAGADIIKIATRTDRDEEVARLESLLAPGSLKTPLAVMGMGPRGAESRLRLAAAGSCLVYGFLDEPNAPGQPSSIDLVRALSAALPAYRAARGAGA